MTEREYELKILALRQSLSDKEDAIANLRVEVTILTQDKNEVLEELNNVKDELESYKSDGPTEEPIVGEIV